jgi:hypothetical protein
LGSSEPASPVGRKGCFCAQLKAFLSCTRLPDGQVDGYGRKKDKKWVQQGIFLAN